MHFYVLTCVFLLKCIQKLTKSNCMFPFLSLQLEFEKHVKREEDLGHGVLHKTLLSAPLKLVPKSPQRSY